MNQFRMITFFVILSIFAVNGNEINDNEINGKSFESRSKVFHINRA